MLSDLRYTLRQLAKSPGFTLTVVLTLALAIGSCTLVFSFLDRIVLRPLICVQPDRLMRLTSTQQAGQFRFSYDGTTRAASWADFTDWSNQSASLESVSAVCAFNATLTGLGEPVSVLGHQITPGYFDLVGIKLIHGRTFLPEEWTEGKNNVVILTYALWQSAYGGAPDIVGRSLQINGQPHTVIGVGAENVKIMGGGFRFWKPYVPTADERQHRDRRFLNPIYARLKPGVSLDQARAELALISARLEQLHPDTNKGWSALLVPMVEWFGSSFKSSLYTLLAAVGGVLLVACANVAGLLLIRGLSRRRELSLRTAFGATRGRLIRLMLTEATVLALLACAGGVLLSSWGLDFMRSRFGQDLVRFRNVELNPLVLAVSVACSLGTVVLFGLLPAWLNSRVNLNESLKQGGHHGTEPGFAGRLRSLLIIFEIAAAFVLLTVTGLFLRSFDGLTRIDPGMDYARLSYLTVQLQGTKYAESADRAAFADTLLARLRSLPGVTSADIATPLPNANLLPFASFAIDGRAPVLHSEWPETSGCWITPGALRTAGIRLLRGRAFTPADNTRAPPVALINETLAKNYFLDEDPVGRQLVLNGITFEGKTDRYPKCEIVGIIADVRPTDPDIKMNNQIFFAYAQRPSRWTSFVFRTANDPRGLFTSVRQQVYAIDKNLPVRELDMIDQIQAEGLSRTLFLTRLLACFALIALLIAAVGLYGVVAFSVGRRTCEFGIRIALGAEARTILALVLHQGLRLTALGLLLGLTGSLLLGRFLKPHLYATSAYDAPTMAGVAILLGLVSLLASWLPARRATRINPVEALRAE